jgi:hypothetical protein
MKYLTAWYEKKLKLVQPLKDTVEDKALKQCLEDGLMLEVELVWILQDLMRCIAFACSVVRRASLQSHQLIN